MRDECFRLYRKLVGIIQIIVFRDESRNLGQGLFPRPADVGLAAQKPVAEEAGNKKRTKAGMAIRGVRARSRIIPRLNGLDSALRRASRYFFRSSSIASADE